MPLLKSDQTDPQKRNLHKVPGAFAAILMIAATIFWTYWGISELYHEGWWGAWYNRLYYLAPIAATLIPTLVAFRWPLAGGVLIIFVGVFALFFFDNDVAFIGLAIALVGVAFLGEGILKRKSPYEARIHQTAWWRRDWRYLLALGAPLIITVGVSAIRLPVVLTRVDDGDRSIRLIEGHEVNLIWAPEGPGWNWVQPWGGYPSWQRIALYGVPPIGFEDKPGYGRQENGAGETIFATEADMAQTNLCRYLNAAGTALLEEPQDIWRMPTTDELIRSLGRHGENAGCEWGDEFRAPVPCTERPDKESPLWATDHAAIYYWAADSYSNSQGYYVSFNGWVNATYKLAGNSRHSYRCIRDP